MDFPALLLSGEQWRISDALSNRLHFHNCLEIGFCHTNAGTLVFEDASIPFRAGDVTIIPRHIPHTTCSQKGTKSLWSYLFLDLNDLLSPLLPMDSPLEFDNSMPEAFLFSKAQSPRIHFAATCLLEALKSQGDNWVALFRAYALVLHQELLRLNTTHLNTDSSTSSFVLKPVLEYIRSHYMERTSMKELADICHLSETHFRRLFLSIMGTSPLSFINTTRIYQAGILLDTTDQPILSIAEAVGISSISSFNRNFHQIMGVSPREYRNASSKLHLSPKQKYVLPYKGWLAAEDRPEHVTPAAQNEVGEPRPSP